MADKYKQVIILRKDLNMSSGKAAVQACHASMAFLTSPLRGKAPLYIENGRDSAYKILMDHEIMEHWINGVFTKTICEAKNKPQLMEAVEWAEEKGLKEGKDYFLIKDICLTELTPEETDENGTGRTLTCIGFRPLPVEIANELSHKYHLYK